MANSQITDTATGVNVLSDQVVPKFKVEGTTRTYGQMVEFFLGKEGELGIRTQNAPPPGEDNFFDQQSVLTEENPVVAFSGDTIVKLLEHPRSLVTVSPQEIRFSVSQAAASTTEESTSVVVDSRKEIADTVESVLIGSSLSNFSRVIPRVESFAVVRASTSKSKEQIRKIFLESQKVGLSFSLKSQKSESVMINLLKVPNLKAKFQYNFFKIGEDDVEKEEDQSRDPLANGKAKPFEVPRFVKLTWNVVGVSNRITGTDNIFKENRQLRDDLFSRRRGVIGVDSDNFRDSLKKDRKHRSPITRQNTEREIVDVHEPETAVESIANPVMFGNSVTVVFNAIKDDKDNISEIPYASITEI
jgi:hypothetical protein